MNTCSVTEQAQKDAAREIRPMKRDHPDHFVIVTGCGAQNHPYYFLNMQEVDQVMGNADKECPESFHMNARKERLLMTDIREIKTIAPHFKAYEKTA